MTQKCPTKLYVFFETDKVTEQCLDTLLAAQPKDRQDKTRRFVFFEDRVLSAIGYAMLQYALFEQGVRDVRLGYNENGKPFLEGENGICFNISHTKGCVCLAIAPVEVGVDVEWVKQDYPRLVAQNLFGRKEYDSILRHPTPSARFYTLWTLKESYVKSLGTGLAHNLRGLDLGSQCVTLKDEGRTHEDAIEGCTHTICTFDALNSYTFETYMFDNHCLSLCRPNITTALTASSAPSAIAPSATAPTILDLSTLASRAISCYNKE